MLPGSPPHVLRRELGNMAIPPLSTKVDTGVIHMTNWTGGPSTVARIFMLINDNSLLQTIYRINIACIYRKREHGNLDRKYWKDKR